MLLHWPYITRVYDELARMTRPASADEPESFNTILYDTQSLAAAGDDELEFFSSTAASLTDRTLSNFPTGTLAPGEFFEVQRVFIDILSVPSVGTGAVASTLNDLYLIHHTARAGWLLEMTGKRLLQIPLAAAGGLGAIDPFAFGSLTAPAHIVYPRQTFHGGFPILGGIMLAPVTKVTGFVRMVSTAISAVVNVRLSLAGTLHRRVA